MKKILKLIWMIFIISTLQAKELSFNTSELMGYYKNYGLEFMLSVVDLPESVKLIEVGDGTLNIETSSVKLEEFNLFAQTTINVKPNGFIVANINLSDEDANQIAQSSIDISKSMDINLSNGELSSHFKLNDMDVIFHTTKNGEVNLSMTDENGDVKEFNTPVDSKTSVNADGKFVSTNEFNAKDGTLNTEITIKDGLLSANATNSLGEVFEVAPPSESYCSNIEIIQNTLLDSFKNNSQNRVLKLNSIRDGGLQSTYSIRREFSLKGYFTRGLRDINVNSGSDILVIPDGNISCKQNSFFDGTKSVILTKGSAKIVIDGLEDEMKLNEEYILNSKKSKILNLNSSWNLISIPVLKDVNLSEFENFKTIWSFDNNWIKNPEILSSTKGFWIDLKEESNITFWGVDYKPNFNDLNSSWQLLGTGTDLTNLKSNWNFKRVWIYEDSKWIENPEIIKEGVGFWVLPL